MAEYVREREREAEARTDDHYEQAILRMRAEREAQLNGQLVSTGSEWQMSRQGRIRYFAEDLVPIGWNLFQHHIRVHSGKHRHQGGLVIFVLEGEGYSVVDGERIDWKAGDLLLLPIKPGGVEHQHFNTGDNEETHWMAFYYEPWGKAMGNLMEQVEETPEYRR